MSLHSESRSGHLRSENRKAKPTAVHGQEIRGSQTLLYIRVS